MATAIQLPVQTGRGAKYLAKARKQQREAKARFFDKNRAERAFEAQAMIKFETFDFLHHFIHNSEWKDLAEQITIDWDSLPPKSEVEGYGKLNKADGTRACRKLFKAAVIWDDLGCSLWENLSGHNTKNRNMIRIPEEDELSSEHEQDGYTLEAPDLARQPSISSKVSQGSAGSRRPSVDHLQDIGTALERTSSAIFKGRRRGTDPVHTTVSDKCSHIGFPRIISHNVRRTMGSFGESMIQGHGGRAV